MAQQAMPVRGGPAGAGDRPGAGGGRRGVVLLLPGGGRGSHPPAVARCGGRRRARPGAPAGPRGPRARGWPPMSCTTAAAAGTAPRRSSRADADWAADEVVRRYGDVPVCLAGLGMGAPGGTARRRATRPSTPCWRWPPGCPRRTWPLPPEPVKQLSGRQVLIVHGTNDERDRPRAVVPAGGAGEEGRTATCAASRCTPTATGCTSTAPKSWRWPRTSSWARCSAPGFSRPVAGRPGGAPAAGAADAAGRGLRLHAAALNRSAAERGVGWSSPDGGPHPRHGWSAISRRSVEQVQGVGGVVDEVHRTVVRCDRQPEQPPAPGGVPVESSRRMATWRPAGVVSTMFPLPPLTVRMLPSARWRARAGRPALRRR